MLALHFESGMEKQEGKTLPLIDKKGTNGYNVERYCIACLATSSQVLGLGRMAA